MKKIIKVFGIIIAMMVMCSNHIYAASDANFTKRIVSVVYDDSWSMTDNGQDYKYADYALQNIVGFMNENDELHVVRMSNKTEYQTINISSKEKKVENINSIEKWNTFANETPFEAIETAIECLKERKALNGNSDNTEYWLLVLTDGGFEGMPSDIKGYFENVQSYMADVKYEAIYVFMGGKSNSIVKSTVEQMQNNTCITSSNNEDICRGLFEAAEKIYGRTSLKSNDFKKNNNEVSLNFPFPINKLIIYEQDQEIDLDYVKTSKGETLKSDTTYATVKSNNPKLTSKIIEVKSNNNCIPAGEVTLYFDGGIDLSETKFQVMVDSAVKFELKSVDNEGVEIPNDKLNTFKVDSVPNFVATLINPYDNTIINMEDYVSKSEAFYQYEGNTVKLQYDTNELNYKFFSPIHLGYNTFVAKLNLKGYFNTYSNAVTLYAPSKPAEPKPIIPVLEQDRVDVSNSLSKDYEKVGNITYELTNIDTKVNGMLQFSNIPKGIQLKVNGNTVKKNKVSLTLNEKNDIEIYRNKDYNETDSQNVNVNVTLNDKNINIQDKGVQFAIAPIVRTLMLKTNELFDDANKFTTANVYNKNLYEIIPLVDGKSITKEELKKSKIVFENDGDKVNFKYKIEEKQDDNIIYVYVKSPLFRIGQKNIDTTMTLTTPFNEKITQRMTFDVKWNLLDFLIRLFIPILIIIWIIGIIKKPRFERKNHKIIVAENGKEIANTPLTVYGGLSNLIPFVPQKGKAYDLDIKAADTKRAIIVCKNSLKDGMRYDNEEIGNKKDLKMYEDVFLEFAETKNHKIRYMYTDIVNSQVSDKKKEVRRGRR